jgi:hypothetical protein
MVAPLSEPSGRHEIGDGVELRESYACLDARAENVDKTSMAKTAAASFTVRFETRKKTRFREGNGLHDRNAEHRSSGTD